MDTLSFGRTSLSERERRNLYILEAIRKTSPISKTNISRSTGLNIVTVSNYIDKFVAKGAVIERGLDISSGGRRPELVELNPNYCYAIGIDLGYEEEGLETSMTGILINFVNTTLLKIKEKRPKENIEGIVDRSVNLINRLISDAAKSSFTADKIKGIGIGISGIINKENFTIRNPLTGVTADYLLLKTSIEEKLRIPVLFANDATVAAYAEKIKYYDPDARNIIYMYGDMGAGLIINQELYEGSSGSAGELCLNDQSGMRYKYGDCECSFLKSIDSGAGAIAEARQMLSEGKEKSKILDLTNGSVEKINLDSIIEAAKKYNDEVAIKLLKKAGQNIGIKAAYLINFLNPDMVIIGGGLERAGDIFLSSVRETVRKWAVKEAADVVKIIPSQIGEEAVAFGAANFAMLGVSAQT